MKYDLSADDFVEMFGCTPKLFAGVPLFDDRIVFKDEYHKNLLEKFGFCTTCFGSGSYLTECCGGRNCDCLGQPVSFLCGDCSGSGIFQKNTNRKMIASIVGICEANNGYLFKKSN